MKSQNNYAAALCQQSSDTRLLDIIRNTVLEPVFGDFLCRHPPGVRTQYVGLMDYLAGERDAPAIVLLNLPTLAPGLYDHLYELTDAEIRAQINQLKDLMSELLSKLTQAIVFTFESEHDEPVTGGEASWNSIVRELNAYLGACASAVGVQIADIDRLLRRHGTDVMLCPRTEHSLGLRYSKDALAIFAEEAARLFRVASPKKALVLDCDGVLWGGVFADDGIEHIKLAWNGSGRAYRLFQRELLRLHSEGFLLCLCSKNEESDVRRVFDQHPDMLLRWEHIAAHRISWDNKADGIRAMAAELNIGMESMVFVDDNRFETEAIAAELPEVEVLCLDGVRPYQFIDVLRDTGWFHKSTITADDRMRNRTYHQQKARREAVSHKEYLSLLDTVVTIAKASDPLTLARAAELSQRTNQFNLSVRRFTEAELSQLAVQPDWYIYILSASDRFGELGIVAAAVVRDMEKASVIEGFYLSCRAFSRGFEEQLPARIREDASVRGFKPIGIYHQTEKNQRFSRFYQNAGIEVAIYE